MKTNYAVHFAIMTILIFGVATSPILQNFGFAYAETDEEKERDMKEKDSIGHTDKRCWETDTGELRCEGHDGKCVKTDQGIKCETTDYKRDIKMILDKFCAMSEEERKEFLAKHDYFREHHERLVNYCSMSEEERTDFREQHHDMMMDFKEKHLDMVGDMKAKHDDIRMQKMMEKHGELSDERMDKLKEKFRMHYDNLTDEQRNSLHDKIKDKYTDYFKMKFKAKYDSLTDETKTDLLKRHEEMKAYKAELRDKYHEMSDTEKEQLRADFLNKAKDLRNAWLSPRQQMMAGINVDQIECREGLNLVIMNSNGKALCMNTTAAERLIERGIVVPAS